LYKGDWATPLGQGLRHGDPICSICGHHPGEAGPVHWDLVISPVRRSDSLSVIFVAGGLRNSHERRAKKANLGGDEEDVNIVANEEEATGGELEEAYARVSEVEPVNAKGPEKDGEAQCRVELGVTPFLRKAGRRR